MAASLRELIAEIANGIAPSLTIGVVTSMDPLRVTIKNDISIMLSASSLVIPSGKREQLEVGAEFFFLVLNNNKLYYMLDRT